MSLEGVYDGPTYSATPELADLWLELEEGSWKGSVQQNQFQTQVPQWPPQQQQAPQQMFRWPAAATVLKYENYAATPLMPENVPWTTNGILTPAGPLAGEWSQSANTMGNSLPVNRDYRASLPVQFGATATSPVSHTSADCTMGSSQPGPSPAWYQQMPLTGQSLAQCVSSNQVQPMQTYPESANLRKEINPPHFHITITPNRIARKVAKRKRVRTAFTTDQILALEKVFSTQTYVNKDERQALTQKLNISDRAIKVWFQNRRMKGKRESQAAYECSDEYEPESTEPELTEARAEPSTSSDSYGSPRSELDYIESQILRTDERGFVTLDEKALGSLFNVINAFVPKAVELVKKEPAPLTEAMYDPISSTDTTSPAVVKNELVPMTEAMYDPISPADTTCTAAEDIEQ